MNIDVLETFDTDGEAELGGTESAVPNTADCSSLSCKRESSASHDQMFQLEFGVTGEEIFLQGDTRTLLNHMI
jgi:hypothetical protein